MMSTTTISGWWSAIFDSASNPSTAVKTSQPSLVSSVSAVRRIVLLSSITRTFNPVSFGLPYVIVLSMKLPSGRLGYAFVGAGILWLFNISEARKPRYGVDISRQWRVNIGGVVHSFLKTPDISAEVPATLASAAFASAVAYAKMRRPNQSLSPQRDPACLPEFVS